MILTALTAKLFNAIKPRPPKNTTSDAWAKIAELYPESEERKQHFRNECQTYINNGHSAFHKREALKNDKF